jgi:hypothetical protein
LRNPRHAPLNHVADTWRHDDGGCGAVSCLKAQHLTDEERVASRPKANVSNLMPGKLVVESMGGQRSNSIDVKRR